MNTDCSYQTGEGWSINPVFSTHRGKVLKRGIRSKEAMWMVVFLSKVYNLKAEPEYLSLLFDRLKEYLLAILQINIK